VFNFIHSHAIAHDGLSPGEVSDLRHSFLESYSSGFDFFDAIHRECMNASRNARADPFSRDMILPSLLSTCGKRAAEKPFKVEISVCGIGWLDDFFIAFAKYISENIRPDAEPKLIVFTNKKECEEKADLISASVNGYIATVWNITGAHAAKTTKDEVQRFLELLPNEARLVIEASRPRSISGDLK